MPALVLARIRPRAVSILTVCLISILSVATAMAETPSAVGPLMTLLKSGRLPQERLGNVVELVCRRGNAHDLAYIYQQAVSPTGYSGALQKLALAGLADAARTRKVKPPGDLKSIARLLDPAKTGDDPDLQLAALRLAGLWQVEAAAPKLQKLAVSDTPSPALRQAAIEALLGIGGETARTTFEQLVADDQPQPLRYVGTAALAALDLDTAAPLAARVLAAGRSDDDPTVMLDAFLERQGGADALAAAVAGQPPQKDVAKVALRYIYSIGRSDPSLVSVLSKAAQINPNPPPPTPEEVRQLAADVVAHGDPARGEEIFRRADVSCMKCHSVSKAGGDIGPDLSAVGSSSPVDYLVNSILQPSQAIKEVYATKVVLTVEGKVYQGIVANRDDDRIVLKDAAGKTVEIPTADIEEESEGGSLMPTGLAQFLTRAELVDLVRFLSELGKPGPYAVRSTSTLQRWRVLKPVPAELAATVPSDGEFITRVFDSDPSQWTPAYAKVAGGLPLDEVAHTAGSPVLYVQGEVEVGAAGKLGVRLNATAGVHVWINDVNYATQPEIVVPLPQGRHKITFRVDTAEHQSRDLRVELFKPSDGAAEFAVVDGR